MTYNGYYNYNVWNILLWIDNERRLYDMKIKAFDKHYRKETSRKQFTRDLNRLGATAHKQYSDIKKKKLTQKEIIEIRKSLRDDYKEYKEYRDEHGKY